MLRFAKQGSLFFYLFYITNAFLPNIFWIFKIPINQYFIYIVTLISLSLYTKIARPYQNPIISLLAIGSGLFAIAILYMISLNFIDLSPDSKSDHLEYLLYYKHGWNPIHDPKLTDFIASINEKYPIVSGLSVDDYIKVIAAKLNYNSKLSFILFFDRVEAGIICNFLLVVTLFFFSIRVCYLFTLNILSRVMFCIAMNLNPIMLTQIFINYMDGNHATIAGIAICLTIIILEKFPKKRDLILWAVSIGLFANIKLNAIFFASTFGLAGLFLFYLKHRKLFLKIYLISIFTTFFIGINPYVQNFGLYINGIVKKNMKLIAPHDSTGWPDNPDYVKRNNQFGLFYKSIFARYDGNPKEFSPKIPFSISTTEYVNMDWGHPDARASGFGPLFSAVYSISILLFFLVFKDRKIKLYMNNYLFLFLTLHFMIFVFPHSWWARFVPFFYWAPILLLIPLLKSQRYKFISPLFFSLVILNSVTFGRHHYKGFQYQQKMALKSFNSLRHISSTPKVWFSNQYYFQTYFKKNSLPFTVIEDRSSCKNKAFYNIPFTEIAVCIDGIAKNELGKLCQTRKKIVKMYFDVWREDGQLVPSYCASLI